MKHYIFKNSSCTKHVYGRNIESAFFLLYREVKNAKSYNLQSVRLERHKEGVYDA